MNAISQALKDIKNYLKIKDIQNTNERYGVKTPHKSSKNVLLTFQDEIHDYSINIVKVVRLEEKPLMQEEGENGVL